MNVYSDLFHSLFIYIGGTSGTFVTFSVSKLVTLTNVMSYKIQKSSSLCQKGVI